MSSSYHICRWERHLACEMQVALNDMVFSVSEIVISFDKKHQKTKRHKPDSHTQLAVECSCYQVPSLSLSVRLHICHTSRKMNHFHLVKSFSQCAECNANCHSTHTEESLMNRSCNKSLSFSSHLSLSINRRV